MSDKKIRIALVNEGTAGGIRKRILNVLRSIDSTRFEVTVLLSGNREGYTAEEDSRIVLKKFGYRWIHIPMVRHISPWKDFQSYKLLRKVLQENQFDLIHAHSAKAGFLTRFVAKTSNVGVCIYSPHVFAFQRSSGIIQPFYRLLEKVAASWCAGFIVDSEAEKECILKNNMSLPDRVFVLPDAVEVPGGITDAIKQRIRGELGVQDDVVVFLSAGRLVGYKGNHVLIRAFSNLAKDNSKSELWIAGDGEERPRLTDLARASGVSSRVRFLGHRSDIYEVLSAADCFILVSKAEGSSHALLEAFAVEKPVIVTAVPGILEFLRAPGHFRTVPWNDVDALTRALDDFLKYPFRGASRDNLPAEWFDASGQIRKLEAIYEQMTSLTRCDSSNAESLSRTLPL